MSRNARYFSNPRRAAILIIAVMVVLAGLLSALLTLSTSLLCESDGQFACPTNWYLEYATMLAVSSAIVLASAGAMTVITYHAVVRPAEEDEAVLQRDRKAYQTILSVLVSLCVVAAAMYIFLSTL